MKKLLAIFLLFGIGSCTTTGVDGTSVSIYAEEYSIQYKGRVPDNQIVENYEDMVMPYRAEVIDDSGERYHLGQPQQMGGWFGNDVKRDATYMCLTNSEFIRFTNKDEAEAMLKGTGKRCLVTRYNDTVYYKDFAEYEEKLEQQKQIDADEEERQKQLILTALVDRCTNFGWKTEDNIASCVKQEAYRDLQIQEQEYKMKLLEQRLVASNTVEEKPFFLEVLNFYVEEAERQENAQLRRDIMMLQADTRSLKSKQNTQAALNALYRNNN